MDPELTRGYFNRCDPNESLKADDPRYEPFDDAELRGEPPCDRLLRFITTSGKPTVQLLSGLMGSGKTTELRRLSQEATECGYVVAMTDVVDREVALIDRARPLEVMDTLLAVCSTITEALAQRVSDRARDVVDELWSLLSARLRFPELGLKAELPTGSVKSAIEARIQFLRQPTIREKLRQSYHESPVRFRNDIVAFVEDGVKRVRDRGLGSELVVVLDGLEKTADSSVDTEDKEEACREVFLDNAHALRLPCHVVYTIPPFMVQYSAELGRLYDSELVFIPMVRIQHRDGTEDRNGVGLLLEAIHRRVPGTAFASDEVARRLVKASGGSLRDVLRLLRECLLNPKLQATIGAEVAEAAIRRVQRSYREAFSEEFREKLESMLANDKQFLHSKDSSKDSHRVFGELLRSQILLRYHNEDVWYDVHPLALDLLKEYGKTSTAELSGGESARRGP